MNEAGYPMIWLTLLTGTVDQATAEANEKGYDLSTVLIDANGWFDKGVVSLPTIYMIHTSNMLIWNREDGWMLPGGFEDARDWYINKYIPWASQEEEAAK